MDKIFVVRKYVVAKNAQDALSKERKVKPDECWLDEDWKKDNLTTKDTKGFINN